MSPSTQRDGGKRFPKYIDDTTHGKETKETGSERLDVVARSDKNSSPLSKYHGCCFLLYLPSGEGAPFRTRRYPSTAGPRLAAAAARTVRH
mgnify:CR=1 FL=1